MPDEELVVRDIWPIGDRAFAIAQSSVLGIKVLEWEEADATWNYIDDGTQNDAFGKYTGGIWAPNGDEIYYAVDPGYIYHGKRSQPPATTWSWTRQKLKGNSLGDDIDRPDGYPYYSALNANYPALGVWGTSADDVYAWFANTIYHRTGVAGAAPEWVPEYTADDASASTEHIYFLAAAGTGSDEVWFSGARTTAPSSGACAVLVRKTAGNYQRIADGTLTSSTSRCTAKDGYQLIGGTEGWLTDIHMPSANRIIGLKGARDVLDVVASGDGYSVSVAQVPTSLVRKPLNSLWVALEGPWLSGLGIVVRSKSNVWDGGSFEISTVAYGGAALNQSLHRVRGTSNTNLWAIGVHNALHKTSP
ncbi:hypothetical protein AKJ09_01742 [Labilithrix luteola]|uniref:Uncharacterized protein n=1 Tax=Labilithrix luteola TaxID=1391654 RepID=A0A0K1PNH4_9BACT|nr:hypothetical protein AKJ09_01742 [Labilithrix luteola]